ncbi:scoloptoxin SSD976-like [Diabrotica virgifera virgifera]|uniref:SCP domain-containing protein n=1 Tax=Diabrotica virgifera virgifera TaxID=50390 RepID=A0ABM5KNF9_DIAVI|nr:scoloptoxin SSD976-like [Diabrotica virgifera virgifera]
MTLHIKLMVVIILMISNITYSWDKCKEKWPNCADGTTNVVCLRGGHCRHIKSSCVSLPMDDEFRNHLLREHNNLRNFIASGKEKQGGAPSAANMMVLNYDFDLEYSASCTANKCEMKHDKCLATKKFKSVGQNLHAGSAQKSQMSAVKAWYKEIKNMSAQDFEKFEFRMETGHFTQVVWAKTTRIGCSRAHEGNNYYLACNYGPAGNVKGGSIYKTGETASQCPDDVKSRKYPSLCGFAYDANVAVNLHAIEDIIYGYIFISLYVLFLSF